MKLTTENGNLPYQKEWNALLTEANNTFKTISAEQVLLMQSSDQIYRVTFDTLNNESMTERLLGVLNNRSDVKIDRLVCMWNNGSLDLPALAVRDQLCRLDHTNITAKILLQGLHSFIVKEIGETMPKEYEKTLKKDDILQYPLPLHHIN